MHGTITAIRVAKRFGFIRGDDGIDRFFHHGSLDRQRNTLTFSDLEEGMRVEFEPYELAQPADAKPGDPTKQHNNQRARRVVVMS